MDQNMRFEAPKDLNGIVEIQGRDRKYNFKRGQLKSLVAKLSEAYAKSTGDMDAMNAVFDDFLAFTKISDPLLVKNLRANTTDIVDRLYAADPSIANATMPTTLRGFYMLRHRELLRAWHEEADQEN